MQMKLLKMPKGFQLQIWNYWVRWTETGNLTASLPGIFFRSNSVTKESALFLHTPFCSVKVGYDYGYMFFFIDPPLHLDRWRGGCDS
jgi:hypothetical protein